MINDMKTTHLFVLSMALVMSLAGCKDNKGNNPENPQTGESVVKSTTSVNGGNGIIIEALMKDGTRQYYKVITPSEVGGN